MGIIVPLINTGPDNFAASDRFAQQDGGNSIFGQENITANGQTKRLSPVTNICDIAYRLPYIKNNSHIYAMNKDLTANMRHGDAISEILDPVIALRSYVALAKYRSKHSRRLWINHLQPVVDQFTTAQTGVPLAN